MAGRVLSATMAQLAAMVGPDQQTIVLPVAEGLRISTDGTTGVTSLEVTEDAIAKLGPYTAEIQAYTTTEGKTTNMQWKAQFRSSTSGRNYNSSVDLFSCITANGEALQPAYSTANQFGLKMRFYLACQPSTGSAVESATVWCYLAFRLRT